MWPWRQSHSHLRPAAALLQGAAGNVRSAAEGAGQKAGGAAREAGQKAHDAARDAGQAVSEGGERVKREVDKEF